MDLLSVLALLYLVPLLALLLGLYRSARATSQARICAAEHQRSSSADREKPLFVGAEHDKIDGLTVSTRTVT